MGSLRSRLAVPISSTHGGASPGRQVSCQRWQTVWRVSRESLAKQSPCWCSELPGGGLEGILQGISNPYRASVGLRAQDKGERTH
jgi:hypothetical protein